MIPSVARPNQVVLDDASECMPAVTLFADEEARWTKKGKQSFWGGKGWSAVDAQYGYTEEVLVAPANASEVKSL